VSLHFHLLALSLTHLLACFLPNRVSDRPHLRISERSLGEVRWLSLQTRLGATQATRGRLRAPLQLFFLTQSLPVVRQGKSNYPTSRVFFSALLFPPLWVISRNVDSYAMRFGCFFGWRFEFPPPTPLPRLGTFGVVLYSARPFLDLQVARLFYAFTFRFFFFNIVTLAATFVLHCQAQLGHATSRPPFCSCSETLPPVKLFFLTVYMYVDASF